MLSFVYKVIAKDNLLLDIGKDMSLESDIHIVSNILASKV